MSGWARSRGNRSVKETTMVIGRLNCGNYYSIGRCFCVMSLIVLSSSVSASAVNNIALGKSYTCSTVANYPLTADAGDSVQLTDGLRTTSSCMWTDKLSVGWSYVRDGFVAITIDLGEERAVSGGSFSTAFGRAGVTSPFAVYMLVSDTGEADSYCLVGDLILASAANGIPRSKGYMTHSYASTNLPCRGRYVKFVAVVAGIYLMCDEVEVFAGEAGQVDLPRGSSIKDSEVKTMIEDRKLTTVVKWRLAIDLTELEGLPGFEEHSDLWQMIDEMPVVSQINWRKGVPYNGLHRDIWAQHAGWARNELGNPSEHILVWSQGCLDDLQPFDLPTTSQLSQAKVDIEMIRNEYRSAVLNLTNISDNSQIVELQCGYDGSGPGEILTVRKVVFVETQGRRIIANALPEARKTANGWQVEVPAGATRQVYLTFHSDGSAAGEFLGHINVSCGALGVSRQVPLRLEIHPVVMPLIPTLSLTAWDYCHGGGYIRYENTWKSAISLMKEYSFRTPWMAPATIPWPDHRKGEVDRKGNIVKTLDWSRVDQWISLWGDDAKLFMFYFGEPKNVPNTNYPLDSPQGKNEVTQFLALLVERFQMQGIPADKIVIHPRDEPHAHEKDSSIVAWANLIHSANPAIKVFTDPIWKDPREALPELFQAVDIVCPNLNHYPQYGAGGPFVDFYDAVRDSGKALWTYQCNGPVNELNLYSYFRLEPWHAFLHKMTGVGFWALADAHHAVGSWNDFVLRSATFSIMYWDENGVTPSKQMEAIRQGVQDYEYLVMLKKAIGDGSGVDADQAAIVLDNSIKNTCKASDSDVADIERLQVLEHLLNLQRQ